MDDLINRLPTIPRPGMVEAALERNLEDELGGNLLIFARESYCGDTGWDLYDKSIKPKWGARCTCTACGEDFWAGWLPGGGITMFVGEDGTAYDGIPDKGSDIDVVAYPDGDNAVCPCCLAQVKVTHRKNLKNGRTHRIMAGSVEIVGDITVVMSWMITRRVDVWGCWDVETEPAGAVAILPGRKLRRYTHMARNGYGSSYMLPDWRLISGRDDPFQIKYYSHEAVCHKKHGAWTWPDVPDLTGTTGEKTGLAEYIKSGGAWPVVYLHLWQQRPAVENLLKCGWTRMIVDRIDDETYAAARSGFKCTIPETDDLADWDLVKPREMLFMTKEEIRHGKDWNWSADTAALWNAACAFGLCGTGCATYFNDMILKYGFANVNLFVGTATDGYELPAFAKIDAYIEKQYRKFDLPLRTGFSMYIDYFKELDELVNDPQDDEIWPRDLRAAHDRLFSAKKLKEDVSSIANFEAIAQKWGALEWSDGEICIRLPRCNNDLVAEGHTLHHCVGGYGKNHLRGNLVLFVRHARRPERSWYTLNIDTTGKAPHRIQLHGYGNEWADGKRLQIPQRVLDFCDRWEQEILAPVFDAVKAKEAKQQKKKKGAA